MVNQSSAAILDQHRVQPLSAAQYQGIRSWDHGVGHHSPRGSDRAHHASEGFQCGRLRYLSDILRAIYFAVQNGARVIQYELQFLKLFL